MSFEIITEFICSRVFRRYLLRNAMKLKITFPRWNRVDGVIIDQTLVIWLVTISFDHNVVQKSKIAR